MNRNEITDQASASSRYCRTNHGYESKNFNRGSTQRQWRCALRRDTSGRNNDFGQSFERFFRNLVDFHTLTINMSELSYKVAVFFKFIYFFYLTIALLHCYLELNNFEEQFAVQSHFTITSCQYIPEYTVYIKSELLD